MIRLEVVDLFPEDGLPEVFAEEFDDVEGCRLRWLGLLEDVGVLRRRRDDGVVEKRC